MTRYLSLAEFWYLAEHVTDINDGTWDDEHPDTDDAVAAMLAVAAREVDEAWLATWLRERVTFRH